MRSAVRPTRIHGPLLVVVLALAQALLAVAGCSARRAATDATDDASTSRDVQLRPAPDTLLPSDASPRVDDGSTSDPGRLDARARPSDGAVPDDAEVQPDRSVPPLLLTHWDLPDGPVKRGLAWQSYREGIRLLRGDDVERAREHLERAVEVAPSYALALGALGVVYMRSERWDDCLDVSRRCVERAFDNDRLAACTYNFGVCLEHLGDDVGALDAHRTSLEYRESSTTRARAAKVARRLGVRLPAKSARALETERLRRASKNALGRDCGRVSFPDDRPGVAVCGPLSAWGHLGSYTSSEAREAWITIADSRDDLRGGSGVLLREVSGQWQEVARTNLLAPGEGGTDYLGNVTDADGRDFAIVQSSICVDGCCRGSLRALSVTLSAGEDAAPSIRATRLATVGTARVGATSTLVQALVTGTRRIRLDGDGSLALLLRYETRHGRANPDVAYLRVALRDGAPVLVGALPDTDHLPECSEAPTS